MKTWKCIFGSLLLIGLVLISAVVLSTQAAATESDLTFELNTDGQSYSVAGCAHSATGILEIPATYNGLPVTEIGYFAFSDQQNLTGLIIPSSITRIREFAFEHTSLTDIYIDDLAAWCNITFEGLDAHPLYHAKNLYLNGQLVTELVIPNGVTSIGDYAFYEYSKLTSVTIPDSVINIGQYAFRGSGVTKVTLGKGITQLRNRVFSHCARLTSVIIPDGVTYIGTGAFYNCDNLTSVVIPDSVTKIDVRAFYACQLLKDVYYNGTPEQWDAITIEDNNRELLKATLHFPDPCADGHSEETLAAVPPTCTTSGLTEGKQCSVCDKVLVAQEKLSAAGHNWNSGEVTTPPTTNSTGVKTYTCNVCGQNKTEDIAKLSPENDSQSGNTDKTPDNTPDGATDETTDNTTDTSTEDTTDGTTEDTTDGTTDGTTADTTDGTTEGTTDSTADPNPEPTEKPEGKNNLLLVIIIVTVVIVLGLVGLAVYFLIKKKKASASE